MFRNLGGSFSMNFTWTRSFIAVIWLCLVSQPIFGEPPRKITIDGNFADWADVPACHDPEELKQAFLDQSSGQYHKGKAGPYKPGFVRMGAGTYAHYTEWVYHPNHTITFVKDEGPQVLGIIRGALSADGHELEMVFPFKGFLVDAKGKPLLQLGQKINA